jgi:hypothetical protein
MADTNASYIESAIKQFEYYKMLADKTFEQLTDEQLNWEYIEGSNSIAVIVMHLSGNMRSRWTSFLTSDGEKSWRNRDAEFENTIVNRQDLLNKWNEGWNCLFGALKSLTTEDLDKVIYIRNQGHTVMEAINRQLAHYPYHVGQIVLIGKMLTGDRWNSLSIARGNSSDYNAGQFAKPKQRGHFTDGLLGDSVK